MSFGPSIMDVETAVEEGWLESPKDFKPMLRHASVSGVPLELEGAEYTDVNFFFKQGGNDSASKEWLGDIRFKQESEELTYKFHTDGHVQLSKRSDDSKWVSTCRAQAEEAQTLNEVLIEVKQHLHSLRVGEIALS